MHEELQWQAFLALLVSFGMQWLKRQNWFPVLTYTSGTINRIVAIVLGSAAGFGIMANFDGSTGTFTLTGLTLANIQTWVSHVGLQLLLQQAAYRGLIAPPKPGAEQAADRAAKV